MQKEHLVVWMSVWVNNCDLETGTASVAFPEDKE